MDIDTRTDVYALGVMLYELLTGSPPLDAKQFQRGAILEMLRMVREVDPPRPSTKLSTAEALPNIAANRSIEPARLAKLLQGELDWVVMKALEKDRNRRYETANGFARDIQRYLADEVVEARPPSRGYRLKKFVKRNKGQVIAASLVFLTLLGGIVGTSLGIAARRTRKPASGIADDERARRSRGNRPRRSATGDRDPNARRPSGTWRSPKKRERDPRLGVRRPGPEGRTRRQSGRTSAGRARGQPRQQAVEGTGRRRPSATRSRSAGDARHTLGVVARPRPRANGT